MVFEPPLMSLSLVNKRVINTQLLVYVKYLTDYRSYSVGLLIDLTVGLVLSFVV